MFLTERVSATASCCGALAESSFDGLQDAIYTLQDHQ